MVVIYIKEVDSFHKLVVVMYLILWCYN